MPIVKNSKATYIVEVKHIDSIRNRNGNFYRIDGKTIDFNSEHISFDAWDVNADIVKNSVKEGDILIIEASDYRWPTSGAITKKIYTFKNYTTSFEEEIIITNEKCTRGLPSKAFNCFCGKLNALSNKRPVTHFYCSKDRKLDSFIVKDKKCKIIGNIIRGVNNPHKSILVNKICWI